MYMYHIPRMFGVLVRVPVRVHVSWIGWTTALQYRVVGSYYVHMRTVSMHVTILPY